MRGWIKKPSWISNWRDSTSQHLICYQWMIHILNHHKELFLMISSLHQLNDKSKQILWSNIFKYLWPSIIVLLDNWIDTNLGPLERTLYGDSEYVSFIDSKWGVGKLNLQFEIQLGFLIQPLQLLSMNGTYSESP